MYRPGHFRALLLTAALLSPALPVASSAFAQSTPDPRANNTEVHLRWGARPGVARYRLQLATDESFADIQFDRVVSGNEYQIEGLDPGRYFWRIAPLTKRLGEFSSIGVIEVSRPAPRQTPTPMPSVPSGTDRSGTSKANPIVARGGWRAAVGDIAHPILARLRSRDNPDIVGMNIEGIVFALDAGSGVAIWSTGRRASNPKLVVPGSAAVVLLRSRSGLDNVVAFSAAQVTAIDGATGRELWRTTLPAPAANATVATDNRSQTILVIDNSLQRLLTLDAGNGSLTSQIKLPHRVVGAPLVLPDQDGAQIVLAYDNGQIEVRNRQGALVRSGDAGSPATTPPLLLRGRRGDFVLIGTRGGLTALTAGELTPLGMVALKGDTPRGTLAAADLDGDGSPEVIMLTERGRLIAVSGGDGKTVWEASVGQDAQAVAFADVDADNVLDVVVTGGQSFALALSGRDGSVVWKDNEPLGLAANHSIALSPRSILSMRYGSGALLIAGDPSGGGLRALEFPKGTAPLKR